MPELLLSLPSLLPLGVYPASDLGRHLRTQHSGLWCASYYCERFTYLIFTTPFIKCHCLSFSFYR